ncbi:ABC-F family ATP-binding cassette domain-containing protein [Anaerosporobacter faecicola]|uniref:ABC-F family ATP-binding cassette domain-containing protein n=1 Tax=Anaerosporobacter faecicola TaxID=2718714 RepID=UPI0014391878|nr:ABC-F family ATP-binding cassette domain-containing protein [Anaerosporobacter faecicola]
MKYQIMGGLVKFAATTILENINFEIRDHEKIAIVGRNGCGKTTLLNLIAGNIELSNLDSDEDCGISMAGNLKIGFLKQIDFTDSEETIEGEILKVYAPVFEMKKRMDELVTLMENNPSEQILNEYGRLSQAYENAGGYTYRQDMETVFQRFGFELRDLARPIQSLSGGQQTRIAFVKLLLSKPDILLLDEPTNHLDMPTIEWLEGYLKNYSKAVVIVSHDRMFLDHIIDVTYEIEYKTIKRYPGNYSAFIQRKRLDADKQEKDYIAQQKEIARLQMLVEKWKNTPTKVAMTRSKLKAIEHMDKIEKPRRFDTKAFHASFSPRIESHKEVMRIKKLEIGYDCTLSTINLEILKGQKIAVIGENGKGKSTLLKTLVGQIPALGGSYEYGIDVEMGYFEQQMAQYTSEETILDDFWNTYPNLKQVEVRTALGHFLFSQDDVFKKISQLSGGEKVRLALLKIFQTKPNFLMLDEPTNHMDMVGKQALESMLRSYEGTVLFVSHDRYFVKEVATAMLVFEENQVNYYPCGYEEYLEERQKRNSAERNKSNNIGKSNVAKQQMQQEEQPAKQEVKSYNPGKEESKRLRQIKKLEEKIAECEQKIEELRQESQKEEYATDYKKLEELATKTQEVEEEWEQHMENLESLQ